MHLFDPEVFTPKEDSLPGVKLPTVVPTPSAADIIHGLKDTCSDDALWIVATICEFVKETGDIAFLDQVVPFADKGEATRVRAHEAGTGFLRGAGRTDRHLQGTAGRLE